VAGHGRNQITRELHEQGIKVSHGSISNFINAYKRKHEQPKPSPNDAGISTVPVNIGGPEMRFSGPDSPLLSGIGQAANNVTPRPTDVNTAVQKQEPIDLQEIDFDDIPVNPDVFTDDVDYNPEYDGVKASTDLITNIRILTLHFQIPTFHFQIALVHILISLISKFLDTSSRKLKRKNQIKHQLQRIC
jgi:hypothetical protein